MLFSQGILERSETETKQRLNNQIEKLEREISQLKKKLESEVEQRHSLTKNQEVSVNVLHLFGGKESPRCFCQGAACSSSHLTCKTTLGLCALWE